MNTENTPEMPEITPQRVVSSIGSPLRAESGFGPFYEESWQHPNDEKWNEQFQSILQVSRQGGIALLHGPTGTGKTRMAAEVSKGFNTKSLYISVFDFYRLMKAVSGHNTSPENEAQYDLLFSGPLLTIDNLQFRGDEIVDDQAIRRVIMKRIESGLPTILGTTQKLHDAEEFLGEDIMYWIHTKGGLFEFSGPSHWKGFSPIPITPQ